MDTEIFITGFGPFAKVKVNPSASIGKYVEEMLKHDTDYTASQIHYEELVVSIRAAAAYFTKLEDHIKNLRSENKCRRILLFHIGVHSSGRQGKMRVEVEGYNELFASVPDVDGVLFNHELIEPKDGGLDFHRVSWFANPEGAGPRLQKVIESFNEAVSAEMKVEDAVSTVAPTWVISRDAGRYLCNYTLYRSLAIQNQYNEGQDTVSVASVFIHVCDPSLEVDTPEVAVERRLLNPSLQVQSEQCLKLIKALISILTQE